MEIHDPINFEQLSVEEKYIYFEDVKEISKELRKLDRKIVEQYIKENKKDLDRLREDFIKDYKDVADDNPLKKQLIEDLKILSIEL
jgi:arginyl-tRNA synthetase